MIKVEKGRVPPAAALLQRIESARKLIPLPYSLMVSPMLAEFAAYVAATEERLSKLEGRK
jgi:hypothetical protein